MKRIIKTAVLSILIMPISLAGAKGHDDDHAEIAAQLQSAISLSQVIKNVAADSKGTVMEVKLERMDKLLSFEEGALVYEVETVTANGVMEYLVDPANGKTILSKKDHWAIFDDGKFKGDFKISLEQAVTKAEKATGKRALAAELEKEDGVVLYEIKMAAGSIFRTVFVDPMNGKVYLNDDFRSDDK